MRFIELGHFVRRLPCKGGEECRTQVTMTHLCRLPCKGGEECRTQVAMTHLYVGINPSIHV